MAYDFEFLRVDIEDMVATVNLDRPKVNALNAQSIALCFSTEDQKIGMRTFIEEGPGKAKFTGK